MTSRLDFFPNKLEHLVCAVDYYRWAQ